MERVVEDRLLMVFVFATLVTFGNIAFAQNGYQLGPGDSININVYGEPDLNKDYEIDGTGVISFPFIGEITVSTLTVEAVRRIVEEKLRGRFLKEPKVSVSIIGYRKFFVNGAVHAPGGYPYQPGLTIRKGISLAGGLTERASKKKIFLVRDRGSSPERVQMDDPLRPGELITVGEGFV